MTFDWGSFLGGLIGAVGAFAAAIWVMMFRGRLKFQAPNFIGAHRYNTNDMIILPVAVYNSGANARAIKLKLIVNGQITYHHQVNLDNIKIPPPNRPIDLSDSMSLPLPTVCPSRDTVTQLVGFTQLSFLTSFNNDVICDLWYRVNNGWKRAYRITWEWNQVRNSYGSGLIMSTEAFKVDSKFKPQYPRTLLNK